MIEPRPYQTRAKLAILSGWAKRANRRVLVSMPTGTGKTIMFGDLVDHIVEKTKLRCLVLAHRDELISQAVDKLTMINPDMDIGVVKAERNEWQNRVVVASVQSLHAKRRATITDPWDVIVIDEAHHAQLDNSYGAILQWSEALCAEQERWCRTVGVTATPFRGDNKGLGAIFEELVFTYTIPAAVEDGYLCPLKAFQIKTHVSLDKVKKSAGDFNLKQLTQVVNTSNNNRLVAAAYLKHCKGMKAIAFCVDVAHAQNLAETMNSLGIRARAVWGAMPADERKATLKALADHEIDVITNCMVLSEGYDQPDLGAVLLCRPTLSLVVYQQQVGRVTRISPNKEHGCVLDFTYNSKRLRMASLADLSFPGVDTESDKGTPASTDGSPSTVFVEIKPRGEGLRSFKVELFRPNKDAIAWSMHKSGKRSRRYATAGQWSAVIEGSDEKSVCYLIQRDPMKVETHRGTLQECVDLAEKRLHEVGALHIAKANASWKARAPTEKQLKAAKKWKIPVPKGATSGELSALLGYKAAMATLTKWRRA